MMGEQYATLRFAKGSTSLRFTDKSASQLFSIWNGDGYTVVGVVPRSKWDNAYIPEYFIARSRSLAIGRGEDILATENELEPA